MDVAGPSSEVVGVVRRLESHFVAEAPQASGKRLAQVPIAPTGGHLRRRGRHGDGQPQRRSWPARLRPAAARRRIGGWLRPSPARPGRRRTAAPAALQRACGRPPRRPEPAPPVRPGPAAGRTAQPPRRRGRRPAPARRRPRMQPGRPAGRLPSRRRRRRPRHRAAARCPPRAPRRDGVPSPSRRSPTPADRTSPSCAVARRSGRCGCTTRGTAATAEPSIAAARRFSQPGSKGLAGADDHAHQIGGRSLDGLGHRVAGAAGLGDPRDLDPGRERRPPTSGRRIPPPRWPARRAGAGSQPAVNARRPLR